MAGYIRAIVKSPFTGSAAVAVAAAPPGSNIPSAKDTAWQVMGVTLHYSADPGVESLTITYNSENGSDYDVLLKTQAMSGVVDFWWEPDNQLLIGPGDTLDIAQTNGSTRTYGIEVVWGEVVV